MDYKEILEYNKDFIIQHYLENKSTLKLQHIFNIHNANIRAFLLNNGIEITKRNKVNKEQIQFILDRYVEGYSARDIANKFSDEISNLNYRTILYHIEKSDIQAREGNRSLNNTELTDIQKELLDGLLVSDGCLFRTKKGSTPRFSFINTHFDYCEYIIDNLPYSFTKNYRDAGTVVIRGITCQRKPSLNIQSLVDLSFEPIYKRWYVNGKKIIPEDLPLTKTMFIHWILGDGCLSWGGKGRNYSLTLCTNGFEHKYQEYMIKKIKGAVGLELKLHKNRLGHYRMYCYGKQQLIDFFNWLGDCPVESYSYKFPKYRIKAEGKVEKDWYLAHA